MPPYQNQYRGQGQPRPAPTNNPIFAPKKWSVKGEDLPPEGVAVKIGSIYSRPTNFGGREGLEYQLYIQDAGEMWPRNANGKPLPIKLTPPLRAELVATLDQKQYSTWAELKARVDAVTEIEWAANFAGRTVVLYPEDYEYADKAASAQAGTEIRKSMKIIKVRKFDASTAPQQQAAAPVEAKPAAGQGTMSVGVIEPKTPKEKFMDVLADYPEMVDALKPAVDGPAGWVMATAKAKTFVAKIAPVKHMTIDQLSNTGANIGDLLMPWDAEQVQKVFGVQTLDDLGAIPLADIRAAMTEAK